MSHNGESDEADQSRFLLELQQKFSIGDKSSNPDSDSEFRFYTFMRKLLGIYWIESDIKKWNVTPVDEMSCLCSVVQPQDDWYNCESLRIEMNKLYWEV